MAQKLSHIRSTSVKRLKMLRARACVSGVQLRSRIPAGKLNIEASSLRDSKQTFLRLFASIT